MHHHTWQLGRPRRRIGVGRTVVSEGSEGGAVCLDLRRADLYRILDEVAHAPVERREATILEFEQSWEAFKEAMSKVR